MFKIRAIQNIEEQIKIATACGTVAVAGYFAYAMVDASTEKPMGFSQFDINGDTGNIIDLKEAVGLNDFEAMFILGRSTMNFIDMCGAHKVTAPVTVGDEKLIKSIGFKATDDGYYCDMTGFFTGNCGNH